ncbi:MAG: hypothetical protein ABIR79_25665 [Candidatus Binatia bacterium]
MTTARVVVGVAMLWGAWMLGPTSAAAQLCGDADGSGTVTVTDGVQTLRAAASLSSSCVAGRCDVDGSGAVTVTDGVNVLRKAAGLGITEQCPVTSTNESVKVFLGEMTKIARVSAPASAPMVQGAVTTDCDEGFIEIDGATSTFHACRFGTIVINGSVTTENVLSDPEAQRFIRTDTYAQYEVRFLDTGFTFRQTGTSTIDIDVKANRLVENGTVTIFSDGSALGQDEYTLTKMDFTTDIATATVVNGKLISSLAQAGLADIKSVGLGFVVGDLADVDVEFEDGHFEAFTFDLQTGELTPATVAAARDRAVRPRDCPLRPRVAVLEPSRGRHCVV